MSTAVPTPEVKPLSTLVLAPLLVDPKFLALALGLLIVVVTVYFSRTTSTNLKRTRTKNIILVGPSESGKTSLFAKLAYNDTPATHTSVIPSISPFRSNQLVDLPGHPRLVDYAEKYVKDSKAVVFVVDSGAVVRNGSAFAQSLAPILVALANTTSDRQLLILAHKSDLARGNTQAIERVRTILSREMDALKAARGQGGASSRIEGISKVQTKRRWYSFASAAQEETQEVDEGLVWGGNGGFKWTDVEGVQIEWAASTLKGEEGLQQLETWVEQLE